MTKPYQPSTTYRKIHGASKVTEDHGSSKVTEDHGARRITGTLGAIWLLAVLKHFLGKPFSVSCSIYPISFPEKVDTKKEFTKCRAP